MFRCKGFDIDIRRVSDDEWFVIIIKNGVGITCYYVNDTNEIIKVLEDIESDLDDRFNELYYENRILNLVSNCNGGIS